MWHNQSLTLHFVHLPVQHHVITVNARQQGSFCQTRLHLDWFCMLSAAHQRVVARSLPVNCHSSRLLSHRRHASIFSHRCGSVCHMRGLPDCSAYCSGSECSSRIWILEWCRYSWCTETYIFINRYLCLYVEICPFQLMFLSTWMCWLTWSWHVPVPDNEWQTIMMHAC